MQPISIVPLPETKRDGWLALTADITIDGRQRRVYMRASRGPLTHTADPFLAAALIPAMRLAAPIAVHGVVSAGLLEHTERIQDILCAWYPQAMQRITVRADTIDTRRSITPGRVGSFFSGGIDSFYNALKHGTAIDDLIFIHGLDVLLTATDQRQLVAGHLQQAAQELGHQLLEVETNVRDVLDPYTDYNLHSHGAALGAVALALSPQMRRVYIGATLSYSTLRAHGSHPLLDPLWGQQDLEIIHDGCEYSRWRKAEKIIANPTVLHHLRVCWENTRSSYNCGRCNGCVMVMILLRATGLAEQCPTFPLLDLAQVSNFEIGGSPERYFLDLLLETVEDHHHDPELNRALRARLQRATAAGMPPITVTQEMRTLQGDIAGLKVDLRRVQARLNDVTSSRSWRLTAPLRAASRVARQLSRKLRQ